MVPQHSASKVNGEHCIFRSKQALTSVKPIHLDAALSVHCIQDQRRFKDALCVPAHCGFPSKIAWIYLLHLFPLGKFQIGSNMATVFWLSSHVLFRRLCIMLFSQSPQVLFMSLIDISSLSSIRCCLWECTKHISAVSHFFLFVYILLCLLPFSHHKQVGSGASGNRDWLYWCNRCSPASSLWHRHTFCKVAGTMGDSGNHSLYMLQLLLPTYTALCADPLLPLVVGHESGCNVAWGIFWIWEFLGHCDLGGLLDTVYGQLMFKMWKHPWISSLNSWKSWELRFTESV